MRCVRGSERRQGRSAYCGRARRSGVTRFARKVTRHQMAWPARQHVIVDLNADGKPEIVLLWDALGPTFGYSKMSIFLDLGKTYRTLTTDLDGQVDKLTVKGSTILVDTKTLGPNDPRCCPTVKKRVAYQWKGEKLVMPR
jgi:hypothetical protein